MAKKKKKETEAYEESNIIDESDIYTGGGGGDALTFSMIVLAHMNKIMRLASKEFHGGYWEEKVIERSGVAYKEKRYISDTREEFGNAVDALADITFPHFDTEMKEAEENLNEELEQAREHFTYQDHMNQEKLDEDKFREYKLKNKRQLFRELSSFIKRQGYFGEVHAIV